MAFETFLTVDKLKPRKGRRITLMISLAVHGVVLLVGVAMSFASVEELAPKTTAIPIYLGQIPVPPPPPAGARKTTKRSQKTVAKTVLPKNSIVAPRDPVKQEQDKPDDPNECEGPDCSETGKGRGPGLGDGEEEIRMLPPTITKNSLAIDPQAPQHRPQLPPGVRHAGMSVSALLRVCVDRHGNVVEVKLLRGNDQTVNEALMAAVRTWRYTPFKVDGRPVPFCTPVNYTVQTTH